MLEKSYRSGRSTTGNLAGNEWKWACVYTTGLMGKLGTAVQVGGGGQVKASTWQ